MSQLMSKSGAVVHGSRDQGGLLDARGNPLDSSFKKAPAPTTGPAFGAWSGRDVQFYTLPGGGVLTFDLSALTLDDFRAMRYHPQINASLTLLNFIIHQVDWHIECEDRKIAEMVEANMRDIWTRLVRGMSQAFWAGYSPCVIEYENDVQNRLIKISKIKDLIPESCEVNWKQVEGALPPGAPAGAIPPKFLVYDGIKQHGTPYPIPPENTIWWPCLMENGDYYGRKLLKAAFMPWYFSILIHLFANRYFERFGEPTIYGRAPFDEDVIMPDGTSKSGKEIMEDIVANLRNRSVVVLPSDRDPAVTSAGANKAYIYELDYLECADDKTEILTKTGWKTFDQLRVGEEVMTLNHATGVAEWGPVLKVNVHDVTDREMLSMEGASHSSLTTLGHRWPVINEGKREFSLSDSIRQRDRIPLSAPVDLPAEPKYKDDFVELVAWFWTEGYVYNTGNYVSITQKRFPERIRKVLHGLYGSPVDSFPRVFAPGTPMWRENHKTNDPEIRQFFLNYDISRELQEVAPNKIVSYEFLNSLTRSQIELFIEASLAADGNVTERQSFLMQKDREMAERFQYTCILGGRATNLYPLKDKRFDDYLMWVVSIRRRTTLNPKPANNSNGNFTMSRVMHTGKVWCPTTPNETWLARRNGSVYFTGNSQMRGADFERYLGRLDEEMSLAMFMPLLLMRTADVGSHNLGVQHTQTWLWSVNALTGDMKEYIDRYICERLKAFNFSPNAPKCEWVPHKLGKHSAETLRAIVTELIRQKRIEPADMEEFGTAIGLKLQEMKILQSEEGDSGGDPEVDDRQRTERDRSADGPRGVGEPRATGTEIANRIRGQVEKAFREGRFGPEFKPTMGYRRRFVQSLALEGFAEDRASELTAELYTRMDEWLAVAVGLGVDEYSGPSDFMSMFQRRLDSEIETLRHKR